MLKRLLTLLRQGGTHRVNDLARELDVTPELLEMMLEDLTRQGYLKRMGGSCTDQCTACPMAGMCSAGSPDETKGNQIWALAE
ncbi:MAG: FeoC-like transcriptional regulator [Anaerolineae bacterium]|jgi:hypothetical protein